MNTIPLSVLFGILIFLILLSGFFSGSETALMTLNRYRLRHLAKSGHKSAILATRLLAHPDRLIGLILLGNNFVNILASAIATIIALRLMGEAGIAVATGLLTLVILVFAEVTPKTLATQRAEQIAFFAVRVYTPLMKVLYPLVFIVNLMTKAILELLRLAPAHNADNGDNLSREELRTVVNEAGGLIPDSHQEMLVNILDLENVTVNDIMIPRNDILGIDLEDDWDDILHQIAVTKQSRLPVYRESLDNVVGFIYLRKMLDVLRQKEILPEHLEAHIRSAYFIPENTPLTTQLLNFQKQKRRIGLVVDEYGDILGLVTLEDILEEIVGEFTTDPTPDLDIRPQEDGSVLVLGSTPARQLNRILGWHLPATGPKTLNGVILERLEEIPQAGQVFQMEGHSLEILTVEDNMVQEVRMLPGNTDQSPADEQAVN
ncbi:MAG: HlyC/CorC family transporter [Gammaproteobacteria bacterium]|nr:HlyC/CorC family transporter [Gammaproteobacteria bacterium]